jgi:hypothetical protein
MTYKILYTLAILLFINFSIQAQERTQTVRGTVFDKFSKQPLPYSNIVVSAGGKTYGTSSDSKGEFLVRNVSAGRCNITVSMLGYATYMSNSILVYSGKETVLEIALEENLQVMDEIVVTPKIEKELPLNRQAVVSVRMLGSEEANRYAGSWGDVGRMVAGLAGVASANDTKNDIVIRGNSPAGLLWRIDGFDIPNPNHFGEMGGTGGRIGILNNNQLANSDFYTGAFPAEFGNVTSGIFDLRFRNGNNSKHEFLVSTGFNGAELGAEGPLPGSSGASYIINGRYSFLDILHMLGVPMQSVPKYQDVSAKINVPLHKANLSVIAIAGLSDINYQPDMEDDAEWLDGDRGASGEMKGKQFFTGINYTYRFSAATRLENRFSCQYFEQDANQELISRDSREAVPDLQKNTREGRLSYKADLIHRLNSRNSFKSGLGINRFTTGMNTVYKNNILNDYDGSSCLLNAYFQWQHHFHESFSMTAGVHGQYYLLNDDRSAEPRLGFKWDISQTGSLSIGGGLYSQLQPRLAYFYEENSILKNRSLKMNKSWQVVAGYNRKTGNKIHFKTEVYYQYLFDVPVIPDIPQESIINFGDEPFNSWNYVFENKGKGYNYGIEVTVEKFFESNYYLLFTASLYKSQYRGYDNLVRSSKFDGNFSVNALFGYEWKLGKLNLLSVNSKVACMGGKRYVPASVQYEGDDLVYDYSHAYENHLPAYFRLDLNVNLKSNFRTFSLEWFFEMANITGHKNIWMKHYNSARNSEVITYQYGMMPMGGIRLYF